MSDYTDTIQIIDLEAELPTLILKYTTSKGHQKKLAYKKLKDVQSKIKALKNG